MMQGRNCKDGLILTERDTRNKYMGYLLLLRGTGGFALLPRLARATSVTWAVLAHSATVVRAVVTVRARLVKSKNPIIRDRKGAEREIARL